MWELMLLGSVNRDQDMLVKATRHANSAPRKVSLPLLDNNKTVKRLER